MEGDFFSYNDAALIGSLRDNIDLIYKNGEINYKEYTILIASLLYSIDRVANTVGHYEAYIKKEIIEDRFEFIFIEPLQCEKKDICIYNEDALILSKKLQKEDVDIVFLDPPYNSRQYSRSYHLLDTVARNDKIELFGDAKKPKDFFKSNFSLSSATEEFSKLIENIKAKYIILTYNNTGKNSNDRSNAKIADEDIISILSKKGNIDICQIKHKAFSAGKSLNNNNFERVFFMQGLLEKREIVGIFSSNYIKSPLNYTGGKYKLLPQIMPFFPDKIGTFYDIFCGGANVGINAEAEKIICNDIMLELISIYEYILNSDNFIEEIDEIISKYNLSNSSKNGYAFYGAKSSDGLAIYNKNPFLKLRADYNADKDILKLFVLIIFSFNNQIRFNRYRHFNLPCGKRDFNDSIRENLNSFIEKIKSINISFTNLDFTELEIASFSKNDFIYADPPYFLATATYNENNGWTEYDERKLLNYLAKADSMGIRFALSNLLYHNNKEHNILLDWVKKHGFNIHFLKYSYNNCNYQKKETLSQEVLIKNY